MAGNRRLVDSLPPLLIGLIGGYLLGSIPFGLVLTRLAGLGDIRKIGSGNIGATNVLRTGHKPLALAVLLLDSGKGAIAVLLAARIGEQAALAAGLGAVLGHLFPVWLGFKGGKGMATTLGTLLALAWPVGLIACAVWLAVALIFRISSAATLTAIATTPVAALIIYTPVLAAVALLIAGLVWYKHAANIRRLLDGTEPRIGRKSA
jgi:acyl phosphate:glycerol-3-phosphate acyltransferase